MYLHVDRCCLCLNRSTEKLHHLNDIGVPPDISYHEKINLSLSKLDFKNEYAEGYMLCVKCCSIIDNIYEFNNSSIRNIDIMTHYLTQLNSPGSKPCKLAVELSNCCNTVINNKECIKLENTITSKVANVKDHNTQRDCETIQENSDIRLYQSDNAHVSTVALVSDEKGDNNEININKVVTHTCVNVSYIKEELDIKIEESQIDADYSRHSYELSNINKTPTDNRGCIKLDDTKTRVTDMRVLEDVPLSDSLQANDEVILHQPDDDYVLPGKWVNDVELEYCAGEEEVCIETKEIADGTPVSVAHPMNDAEDTSPHEPIISQKNFSISDPAKKGCNTSYEPTENSLTSINKRVYECRVCEKKCANRTKLMEYKKPDTDEKPFVCDVCNQRFSRKAHLVAHKRIHTGEKPYECEVCYKRFARSEHLVVHKRIHTGEKQYACEVCNKGFTQKGHLLMHKHTHTGEKPYVCEVCNKRFYDKCYLVRHKRIHTGEKPYVCKVCNKGFTWSSNLVKHSRIHTNNMP